MVSRSCYWMTLQRRQTQNSYCPGYDMFPVSKSGAPIKRLERFMRFENPDYQLKRPRRASDFQRVERTSCGALIWRWSRWVLTTNTASMQTRICIAILRKSLNAAMSEIG